MLRAVCVVLCFATVTSIAIKKNGNDPLALSAEQSDQMVRIISNVVKDTVNRIKKPHASTADFQMGTDANGGPATYPQVHQVEGQNVTSGAPDVVFGAVVRGVNDFVAKDKRFWMMPEPAKTYMKNQMVYQLYWQYMKSPILTGTSSPTGAQLDVLANSIPQWGATISWGPLFDGAFAAGKWIKSITETDGYGPGGFSASPLKNPYGSNPFPNGPIPAYPEDSKNFNPSRR